MKIESVTQKEIVFNNGNKITFDYYKECCEINYADFEQIEENALTEEFEEDLIFEQEKTGFRFGNVGKMYFIPCYSEQNGYYTCKIDIYYSKNKKMINIECEEVVDYKKFKRTEFI